MGDSSVNLAALIGSRICHDLISPIGAITNGLELLDMVGAVQGPEMELISGSVGNAGARIRFFRIAFGSSGEARLGRTEIAKILDDLGRASRIKAHWAPQEPKPRTEVKLAFLALLCCETAMPLGGTVEVACDGGQWTVAGMADKMNIESDLWHGLNARTTRARITPALVQFALLPAIAAEAGRRVRAETSSTRVVIRF
ncbi:histidine phosphotransferase [Ruegeria sediminis]|uniref:Histidine phosphotransferase n=1 Tax=Ruegeria sediminis TaxID=2583820 RepID=A0ABY2X049_9RHOB|nr:histidine phosphotransferase family protein [Ruegeria sediminis]TMV08580.1 histidine phosphotransferase [Ruegeria sediminis]